MIYGLNLILNKKGGKNLKKKILNKFSYMLAGLGLIASGASSVGCVFFFVDEPTMPASMIER